jgi:hypothetical protein
MNAAVAPRTATLILLCGSIVVSLSLGIRHTFGLFLQPMTQDLAWSREAFSFAIALQNLMWGAGGPIHRLAGRTASAPARWCSAAACSTPPASA